MAVAENLQNYLISVGPRGFRDLITHNGLYYDPGTFALYVNGIPIGGGHVEQGRLAGVNTTGQTVVFDTPFSSIENILEVSVVGRSSDGLTIVTVGITLTTNQVTFYPSEDDSTICYKFEELSGVSISSGKIFDPVTIVESVNVGLFGPLVYDTLSATESIQISRTSV